jgi:hypothetical protein
MHLKIKVQTKKNKKKEISMCISEAFAYDYIMLISCS